MLDIFLSPWYTVYVKSALHYTFLWLVLINPNGDAMKNKLEEMRRQRGIKQEELADMLGVSRQTISSLENGRYNPSVILAFKIARFFGVRIEDIFIYEEDLL